MLNEQQLRNLSMLLVNCEFLCRNENLLYSTNTVMHIFFFLYIFISTYLHLSLDRLLSERINADLLILTKKSIVRYSGTGIQMKDRLFSMYEFNLSQKCLKSRLLLDIWIINWSLFFNIILNFWKANYSLFKNNL